MRRVNEKRKEVPKENVKNIRKEIKTQNLVINSDLLYILRHYDSRIHFFNQKGLLRNCKKFSKTKLVYTERISFDINLDFYKNLSHIKIKFTKMVDLGYFSTKKLKRIDLNGISKIIMTKPIDTEILRIINSDIEVDTFIKLFDNDKIRSLTLINVNIYSKHDIKKEKDIINIMNSDSDENYEVNSEDLEIEDVTNLYHEDIVNSSICKLFHTINLKKLSLIETNIRLETVKSSGIMKNLNIFKFKTRNIILNYSFSREKYSYLRTNQEDFYCIEDIEHLIIPHTKLLLKNHDFSYIRILSISNSVISNEIMELLCKRFLKCVEFSFLNCSFTDVSFIRFLNVFGKKIRYLNLIDSELPRDALSDLMGVLLDCKVVFRDKRIFKIKK